MAEIITAVAGLVSLITGNSKTVVSDLSLNKPEDRSYAKNRFGRPGAATLVFDVRELRKIEEQILGGDDETVMAFKNSHLSSCGMTAVAVCVSLSFIYNVFPAEPDRAD